MTRMMMVLLLAAGACAAEQKTLSGYLMDKACSADALKKGEATAKGHDVGCALMDDCQASGYGVLAGGRFILFDAAGNKRAVAALKATAKKSDLRVTVTGDVTGDNIKVAGLKLE